MFKLNNKTNSPHFTIPVVPGLVMIYACSPEMWDFIYNEIDFMNDLATGEEAGWNARRDACLYYLGKIERCNRKRWRWVKKG